jgi:NADPH:quinone reductase-like Zn-dependent oxidoreductase
MKTLRIHEFGNPSLAVLEDLPPAEPGPGQVSLRIEAAGVNPLDLKMLAGHMQQVFPVSLPYALGTDLAGVVLQVGPGVARFKAGDRVVGRLEPTAGGAFAQAAVVPEQALSLMPADMSFEQAAALPTAAGTAWLALSGAGKLRAGQRVFIHAAAGGVGSFAVQFARQAGAHVIATASARNLGLAKELGAHEVIDYQRQDFAALLSDVDLVLDTVGGDTLERSWRVLSPRGAVVSTVDFAVAPRGLQHGSFVFFKNDAAALDKILDAFRAKQLQIVLDTIHPLEDARAALEQVAGGHARGKVIVRASH